MKEAKKNSTENNISAQKTQDTEFSSKKRVQKRCLPSWEEKELKHHSRRLSIKDGIFWAARSSFGDHFVAPFAIAMQMATPLVALLNSIFHIGLIGQLFGSKKIGQKSRKSIITKPILIDTFGWLFMAIIALLYLNNIAKPILQYLIIIDFAIILISSGYLHPAWFSWLGDIVDSKFRGRWFAKRSTIISFTTMALTISAAFFLEWMKNIQKETIAFIILFTMAFLSRLNCSFIIKKQYEPELKIKKEKKITLKNFIKNLKTSNLGKYTLFRSIFAITIGLTAPLTSIYLLRYLELDYISYMAIMLSGTFFSIVTLNLWGKIADKYGNYKIIALTTLIIPLTPLLWILSSSKIYLLIVPALLGGVAWSAFIMGSTNFIYDNTSKKIRGKALSYFNLFTGIGSITGGLIASVLIKTIKTTWIEPLFLIFIIGSVLRMIPVAIWVPKLKEIKHKKRLKNIKELKSVIFKEAKPTILEDIHEIASIGKYIKER
jgi:MFS family permease